MEWERAEQEALKNGKTLVGMGPKGEPIYQVGERALPFCRLCDVLNTSVSVPVLV
jgi:hypothetical protein